MQEIEARVVTLDGLVARVWADDGDCIKIDTYGWEERVLVGGEKFMRCRNKRFAPEWRASQGTDPLVLLEWLLSLYDVYERAGWVRRNARCMDDVVGMTLTSGTEKEYVRYVRNLVLNDKDWADRYIFPPAQRRAYSLRILDATAL